MGSSEARPQHAKVGEIANCRAAIDLFGDDRLQPGLRDMRVNRKPVPVRDIHAIPQEAFRAVMRNRRCNRDADGSRHFRSRGRDRFHGRNGLLTACEIEPADGFAQWRRQRGGQARDRLKQGLIRDHRCQHRAHAGIGVSSGRGHETFFGRPRKFVDEVEAGRAALREHVDRAEQRGYVDGFRIARSGQPWPVGERGFEGPCLGDAFHEVGMAMGVGVDEAGKDQAVTGIVPLDARSIQRAGRADPGDLAVFDQYIPAIGLP